MSQSHHPLVVLAQRAIDEYVRRGQRVPVPASGDIAGATEEHAGAFVSIHKKNGDLRGCVGTFLPVRSNLAEEVIENAIASATRDPRFYPIQEWELNDLDVSVDVLSAPEPISSLLELDPQVYGVIVTDVAGVRRGLLLPMLEQVTTVEQQVAIARQKAYIGADEQVHLQRFCVRRYH